MAEALSSECDLPGLFISRRDKQKWVLLTVQYVFVVSYSLRRIVLYIAVKGLRL